MASSDISGVGDDRAALERALAGMPATGRPIEISVSINIDGDTVELPYDNVDLDDTLHGAYCVGGFVALEALYNEAMQCHDRFISAHDNEIATLGAGARQANADVEAALQRVGPYGPQDLNRAALDSAMQMRDAIRPSAQLRLQELAGEYDRRSAFMDTLAQSIDKFIGIEEVMQRWYEAKLHEVIDAELNWRRQEVARVWAEYDIGLADGKLPMRIEDADAATGLRIRSTKQTVKMPVFSMGKTIQTSGEEKFIEVHAAVAALHQVGVAWYAYSQAVAVARGMRRPRGSAYRIQETPGYDYYRNFRQLLQELGGKYFVIYATYRKVVEVDNDMTFNPKLCERLIIRALLDAYRNIPKTLDKLRNERLFVSDEQVSRTGGRTMGKTAAETLVQIRYRGVVVEGYADGYGPPPGTTQVKANAGQARTSPTPASKAPDIFNSPWLQAPFHERFKLVYALITAERESKVSTTNPDLEHLRGLFTSEDDIRYLSWICTVGSASSRARLEMVRRLTDLIQDTRAMRDAIAKVVGGIGLVAAPFTEGGSLVVAGAVDAMLVADQTADSVAKWLAAEQFSKLVLDQIADMHWREPAVAELAGTILEAGFSIASDLVNGGAAGAVLDGFGVCILVTGLVNLAVDAGQVRWE
jgi:uncharacterized membrane protein